jgi:adenosylcobinamide kinase/adenosylcobinamide-phosphate guanylyltransferase
MGRLTLILGGARSGKSSFAKRLADSYAGGEHTSEQPAGEERAGSIAFIATAQAGDPEMAMRIVAHQSERPAHWATYEISTDIATAWRSQAIQTNLAILDCLTLLVSNLVLQAALDIDAPDEALAAALVTDEIESLVALILETPCDWIVVSNEVGLGLVPPYPLGRIYRDWLGWANQRLAAIADEVYLLVAGIPVPIHQFKY